MPTHLLVKPGSPPHDCAAVLNISHRTNSFNLLPGGSAVKNLPAMQETQVQSLSWEDLLEEETATHSSILA